MDRWGDLTKFQSPEHRGNQRKCTETISTSKSHGYIATNFSFVSSIPHVLVEYHRQNSPTILQHLDFADKILQRHYRALDFANDNKCSESIWILTKLSEAQKRSEKCSHKIEFQQIISGRNKHLICREETVYFLDFWFFFFRLPFQWLACTLRDLKSSGNVIFLSAFVRLTQKLFTSKMLYTWYRCMPRDEFHMKNPISRVWFRHLKPIQYVSGGTW